MFKLIIAELKYSKYQIHNTIILLAVLTLFTMIRRFNPTNLFCFILFMQFISFTYISELKENRNFKYMQLSLSIKEIALFRITLGLIGFIMIHSIGSLSHLVFDFPPESFHDTISELYLFGGLGLIAFYTYLFLSDLFSIFHSMSGFIVFNIIVASLIFFISIFLMISIRNVYESSANTGIGLILLTYIGSIILAIISFASYQFRESHLGMK